MVHTMQIDAEQQRRDNVEYGEYARTRSRMIATQRARRIRRIAILPGRFVFYLYPI